LISLGSAELRVVDLESQVRFYQALLGFERLSSSPNSVSLGLASQELLRLTQEPNGETVQARDAQPGLFHLAYLLPSEQQLGGWLTHVQELGIPLEGASDHGVSQAFYLSDPEGNGLEVYADRPVEQWPRNGSALTMFTRSLDIRSLLAKAKPWSGTPDGTKLGHIHLRGQSVQQGSEFFEKLQILPTVSIMGANFYAADSYHHHFAVNTWGVTPAKPGLWTGLMGYSLVGPWEHQELRDPWGHRVSLSTN
jgi:catechol 2,3-dioxygenase